MSELGKRLLELATQPVYNGWELSSRGFDCFGQRRRALEDLNKDLERWETDGGS